MERSCINQLAIVLVIYGFTLPGLEVISNSLRSYGQGHLGFLAFAASCFCGAIYTVCSLMAVGPSQVQAKLMRFLLLSAVLGLLMIKFVCVNEMLAPSNLSNTTAWCSFLAECIPGLGKRTLLLVGLFGFPPLANLFSPFEEQGAKVKKD